jgi:beta-glucosidase
MKAMSLRMTSGIGAKRWPVCTITSIGWFVFRVKNVGERAGKEVTQLYLRDVISSVTRPVKELRGFEKVSLDPGESKDVEFSLGFDDMSLLDRGMKRVVEPGRFRVMIGASSGDIRLDQFFEVEP